MMRPLRLMLAMLVVGLPAVAHAQSARATLRDAQGTVVGAATLNEVRGGVKIAVQVSGLKPGEHGFHIHAVGMCEPPAFTTAGAHFNPYGREHGHKNPKGSLLQPGGTSLVIHADPDDEKTDPAGDSGTRIVCGVIASTARK